MDKNTLSHTSWRCKYHIVFAPKYRRQVIYRQLRKDIGSIQRELCSRKGINIIEAELCPDHVHMLVEIPPKYSICLLYTSPSPRDVEESRMPSSA